VSRVSRIECGSLCRCIGIVAFGFAGACVCKPPSGRLRSGFIALKLLLAPRSTHVTFLSGRATPRLGALATWGMERLVDESGCKTFVPAKLWLLTDPNHSPDTAAERDEPSVVSRRRLSPPMDQILLAKTPIVQCSGWSSRTNEGPAPHLPWPRVGSVAVRSRRVGPSPQTSLPGLAEDKKKLGFRSPNPFAPPIGSRIFG
jgi:hypothetical protein